MTNKKNIASKLVLALFILTLISCCLLGSTFARYASGGSGTASIGVAKWDVSIDDSAMATITVTNNKLSPSMDDWQTDDDRTHSTGKIPVATITNSSDVAAKVSVTGANAITLSCTSAWGDGYSVSSGSYTGNGVSEDQAKGLFSVTLYSNTENSAETATTTWADNYTLAANGGVVYIFAEVTWTSDDQGNNAAYADAIDTWVGENVTSLSFTLSYTAVQNSEIPKTV